MTIAAPTLGVGTAAHFSGTINPQLGPGGAGLYEVNWHFECTPKCLGPERRSAERHPDRPRQLLPPGRADVVLEPNTEYHVTLVATNAGASATASPVTVTTPPFAADRPHPRGQRRRRTANLGAKINPLNAPVTYQFEWGPTDGLRKLRPGDPEPLSRADNAYHFVSAPISGLSPASTYHYRVIATNTQTR